jgi:hypothetical protein
MWALKMQGDYSDISFFHFDFTAIVASITSCIA